MVYDLSDCILKSGNDSFIALGYEYVKTYELDTYKMKSIPDLKFSILQTRLWETKRLIKWIAQMKPDVIHFHNLHNHYINIEFLFDYIKKHHIPVAWTLHDCWSFTGRYAISVM
ncbi:glycosyltransferase [Sporolactobacillus sp. CQH2019]|uniref:glycosyltransferase n=1 Tax=Sporolactobacillus sp. CQH2019 TaxID=3023512 RepID=UPI0023684B08|nr:glycosyltransferase [Sporolactobacillus sp. CQH2019]MDD9148843.1 glycosyltransferase [Sporolactobacillus sp. CQH2019]